MFRFVAHALICLGTLAGSASAAPKLYYLAASAGEVAREGEFQRRLVLEQRFLNEFRLDSIRFNLGRGAMPFCDGEKRRDFGLRVTGGFAFSSDERRLAEEGFGFDDGLRVQHVIPNSPAQQAGLHSGDLIVRVNGVPMPAGPAGISAFNAAASSTRLTLSVERSEPANASRRGYDVTLSAAEICKFDVELTNSENIGAYASGRHISVTKGMMWFANDGQLAFIIAHEFAHVIGDHSRLVQSGVRQTEVESAADYLGLYIMGRAGYDVGDAPEFFRRIAANFPQMISPTSSHPATPYRYVALTKAVEEIKMKIAMGAPLLPGNTQTALRTTP